MAAGIKTGGGSRKGKQNKATAAIKEMIEGALQEAGGQDYLVRQAYENPVAFMGLVGKILPREIKSEHGGINGEALQINVNFVGRAESP
jgi:hypothetical protein